MTGRRPSLNLRVASSSAEPAWCAPPGAFEARPEFAVHRLDRLLRRIAESLDPRSFLPLRLGMDRRADRD
ncbi:MAG: hypothetical protein AAGN82_10595, partial [Myxococcota bacterium]